VERGPILVWILWFGTAMFLVFFVVALVVLGDTMSALGWLGFLVSTALTASGVTERSRALSYLASGSLLVGILLHGTSFILDTFRYPRPILTVH
jgi:hypothetical protein